MRAENGIVDEIELHLVLRRVVAGVSSACVTLCFGCEHWTTMLLTSFMRLEMHKQLE